MERTFATDITDREELRLFLLQFCEAIAYGLRDKGLRGRTITLKARFADFKTVTRTKTLTSATNLGPRIYSTARELLDRVRPGPLRLVGVQVSGLEDVRKPVQPSLFEDLGADPEAPPSDPAYGEKLARATAGLDRLRKKYGRAAAVPASLLGRRALRGRDGSGDGPTEAR